LESDKEEKNASDRELDKLDNSIEIDKNDDIKKSSIAISQLKEPEVKKSTISRVSKPDQEDPSCQEHYDEKVESNLF
jgi:hypothetical protein